MKFHNFSTEKKYGSQVERTVGNFEKDLRPRQRLHWKLITGNYDQIEVKDVGKFLWTYGVVIGILIARKTFEIIQFKA